jgi:hypothetical protein
MQVTDERVDDVFLEGWRPDMLDSRRQGPVLKDIGFGRRRPPLEGRCIRLDVEPPWSRPVMTADVASCDESFTDGWQGRRQARRFSQRVNSRFWWRWSSALKSAVADSGPVPRN